MTLNIDTGIAYLCMGTTQQVLEHLPLPYTILHYPTTEEILTSCLGDPMDLILGESRILFIFPKELEVYKTSKRKNTSQQEESVHKLPLHIDIAESLYVFIICTDILGQVTNKSAIKKIEGGVYTKLDLSAYDYNVPDEYKAYPHSYRVRQQYNDIEQKVLYNKHRELILSLKTLEGVDIWSNFKRTEVFKYFLIPHFNCIPILAFAKANALQPYLEPYVAKFDTWGSYRALNTFAYWMYCCHAHWSVQYGEGLTSYTNKSGVERLYFRPSKVAMEKWWEWLIE